MDIEILLWVEVEVEEDCGIFFFEDCTPPPTARAVLKNAAFFLHLANFQIQIHF